MSTIIGGVVCEEIVADFEEGIEQQQGPYAQKSYLCDWAKRYTLANALMGVSTGGTGGLVTFSQLYPYPESSNLFPTQVTIKGKGQPSQGLKQLQFEYAVVAVHFGVLHYNPIPPLSGIDPQSIDPEMPIVYATQELDFTVETITLPGSGLVLSDGRSVNEDYGIQVPIATFNITLHKVPFVPSTLILAGLKAPLNSKPIWGGAVRTVRFNGCKTTRTTNTDGSYTQDAHYSFSYFGINNSTNNATWSSKPDPKDAGSWLEVLTVGGASVLATSDLSLVFPTGYVV